MLDRDRSKKHLTDLLASAFTASPRRTVADKVDPVLSFLSTGELSPDEVGGVVADFARARLHIAFDKGTASGEERTQLRELVQTLMLPSSALPPAFFRAMMSGP
jgi:hypothetical protein